MYDYLIIGQGIAGSVLGYTLLKKGKKIFIADSNIKGNASRAAAGIFNPVTGKRKAKTWNGEQLFPFMEKFYLEMEAELGERLFYRKPVYMLFESNEEINTYMIKAKDEFVNEACKIRLDNKVHEKLIYDNFGGLVSNFSGYVDVEKMLDALKKKFFNEKIISSERFSINDLKFRPECVAWNNIEARAIIFCEGSFIAENPLFNWLPINPVKGELLRIKINPEAEISEIINKGIYILPVSATECLVGATYEWNDLSAEETLKGKNELKTKLEQVLKIPFSIIDHRAGIRPATKDRRPFIGMHPVYKNAGVFNGFGTKAISMAPYLAFSLYEFMESGKDLDPEINIERHFSLYYSNLNN